MYSDSPLTKTSSAPSLESVASSWLLLWAHFSLHCLACTIPPMEVTCTQAPLPFMPSLQVIYLTPLPAPFWYSLVLSNWWVRGRAHVQTTRRRQVGVEHRAHRYSLRRTFLVRCDLREQCCALLQGHRRAAHLDHLGGHHNLGSEYVKNHFLHKKLVDTLHLL